MSTGISENFLVGFFFIRIDNASDIVLQRYESFLYHFLLVEVIRREFWEYVQRTTVGYRDHSDSSKHAIPVAKAEAAKQN